MDTEKRQLSLVERWELDIKSYEKGVNIKISSPQCKKCKNYIKADALHCSIYRNEKKPKDVMFCRKECSAFVSDDILEISSLNKSESKLYGGIFGFCIGDMLGVPVEFSTREERANDQVQELRAYGTYHQPFGVWSDDTSMTLCLIDAINNGFSLYKLAENFKKYYKEAAFTPNGEVFDIGNSTQIAIEKMIRGIEPVKCGGASEIDNGNGSLMRILPIAYMAKNLKKEDLIKMIEDVSSLTHAHDRTKLACIIYTVFGMYLIKENEKMKAYDETIQFIKRNCQEKYLKELKHFENILTKSIISFDKKQIKSTGYVVDTLEAVFWLFLNFDSYKKIVLEAVNLGGDTDTIAAIAGGIAGIYYGFDSIPDRWVQNVARKHEINEMLVDFYRRISLV